jgi:uncharacterized protein YoxC
MTVQVDIFALIVLVVFLVVAAFLLPLIWQWKKTGKEAEALMSDLRRELVPTVRDCREISERINRASMKIEKGSGHAENLLESLDEVVVAFRQVSQVFNRDACQIAELAACLMLGIRVACKVLVKGTQEKGD